MNAPCSHLQVNAVNGMNRSPATIMALTWMLQGMGNLGEVDPLLISFVYCSIRLLLSCIWNGTPCITVILLSWQLGIQFANALLALLKTVIYPHLRGEATPQFPLLSAPINTSKAMSVQVYLYCLYWVHMYQAIKILQLLLSEWVSLIICSSLFVLSLCQLITNKNTDDLFCLSI
jgi:hypothetical protein